MRRLSAAPLLRADLLGVLAAREEKRRDRRRHLGGDLRDALPRDHARPARHLRDEAERGRAGVDGEARFVDGGDAADFDAHAASVYPSRRRGINPATARIALRGSCRAAPWMIPRLREG